MKAVARLMLVYFTGTPLLRAMSAAGLTAVVCGTAALAYFPPLLAQMGGPSRFSIGEEALLMLAPLAGIIALVFGGSLMPAVVTRLATGRYAHVLPHACGRLLASAFGTVAFVSLVAATAMSVLTGEELPAVSFTRLLAGSMLTYSSLYLVLWVVGRFRSSLALVGGALLAVGALMLPLRFMGLNVPLRWAVVPTVAIWTAVAAALLLAPRLAALTAKLRRPLSLTGAYAGGDELDLVVGTSRPWLLALGQIVPIVVAAYLVGWLYGSVAVDIKVKVWLFYLVLVSVLTAATTSFAAARSRTLWLRTDWTRAELYARVEAAFWKRNCYTVGVVLITMAIVGTYFELPNRALAFGIALLVLATTVSTYLGLMVTRSIGWGLAALAVGSMLLLFRTSTYATNPGSTVATIVSFELALALLAVALRVFAKHRWLNLDWMLSRPDTTTRAAA